MEDGNFLSLDIGKVMEDINVIAEEIRKDNNLCP